MRRWWALLGAIWVLAACGGGGADADAGDPGGGSPPPAAFSAEQRAEATARIAIEYEKAIEAQHPAPLDAARDYALRQPEFAAAGTGDGLIWARFTDGRTFVYFDNWGRVALPEQASEPSPEPAPESSAAPAARRAAGAAAPAPAQMRPLAASAVPEVPEVPEVPASPRAIFLKLVHEDFVYANGLIRRMQAALKPRGWVFDEDSELNVGTLKKLQNHGFVFLTSHASWYDDHGIRTYGIMTESYADTLAEIANKDDLDDGSLLYSRERGSMLSRFGREYPNWIRSWPRYTASARFVRKYMSFAPHSLVVLMMCNGGTEGASDMRQAFFDKGAGTVMAWNGYANPYGYAAVELLVDRMTGANRPVQIDEGVTLPPTAQPQRAFEKKDVIAFLQKSGVLNPPGVDSHAPATIEFFGEGFKLFHPVLASLRATGKDKLILNGSFGSLPQVFVEIDGTPVLVDRWNTNGSEIEVTLPTGPGDPPGSMGRVVVQVGELRSNPRQLRSWRGDLSLQYEELYGTEPDVFRNRAVAHLHIRADAHGQRDEVDGPVRNNTFLVSVASDSRAEWLAEGGCPTCHLFHEWSGRREDQEFAYDIDPSSPYPPDFTRINNHNALIMINAVDGKLQAFLQMGSLSDFTVTHYETPVRTTEERFHQLDPALFFPSPTGPWAGDMPLAAPLRFDAEQRVTAQKLVKEVDGSGGQVLKRHTIEWGTFMPSPAYDPRIGR
jgi:hypothetical protein